MNLETILVILFYILPGSISLYLANIIYGYEPSKNNFDKIISYIFHTSIILFFGKLCFNLNFIEPSYLDLGWIFGISIFWGLIFSLFCLSVNKFNFPLNGIKINTSLLNELFRNWFIDGYAIVTLKNGLIYKGWIYSMENFSRDHYLIALSDYEIIKFKSYKNLIKPLSVRKVKIKDYQIILFDSNNITSIEFAHERMANKLKNLF